jgi:hypothetical protein
MPAELTSLQKRNYERNKLRKPAAVKQVADDEFVVWRVPMKKTPKFTTREAAVYWLTVRGFSVREDML